MNQQIQSSSKSIQSSTKRLNSSNSKKTDYSLKILLIGNSGVGKSSILMRYSENKFLANYYSTIGVDYQVQKLKFMQMNGKTIKLQIWDTAGQDRFKTIVSSYYRGAHGILIVYDVSDRQSFEGVSNWLNEIEKLTQQNIVKYLVGNKSDLQQKRQVSYDQGKMLGTSLYNKGQKLKIGFKETSARLATNIDDIFKEMTEQIIGLKQQRKTVGEETKQKPQQNIHKLINDKQVEKKKEDSCC